MVLVFFFFGPSVFLRSFFLLVPMISESYQLMQSDSLCVISVMDDDPAVPHTLPPSLGWAVTAQLDNYTAP